MESESGDGLRIFAGQMYVEQLAPTDGVRRPWPIVFNQGGGPDGKGELSRYFVCSMACMLFSDRARFDDSV